MKKLALILGLLAASASPARAGIYYDLQQTASSATLRIVGAIKWYASTMGSTPVVQIDQTGFSTTKTSTFSATGTDFSINTSSGVNVGAGGVFAAFFSASSKFIGDLVGNVTGNLTGNVTGNASTATALAADGANCSSGNYPLGVDASGAVQNCTAAGIGDAVKSSSQTFSGANVFTGTTTLGSASGGVTVPFGTTCTGMGCRVEYSSGTLGYFQHTFYASTTYNWSWSTSISSGSGTAACFRCTVNGSATTANYFYAFGAGYPNAYQDSNTGTKAYFDIFDVAGGGCAVGAGAHGQIQVMTVPHYNIVSFVGTITSFPDPASNMNVDNFGAYYKGAPPWTIKCFPVAGIGWEHESLLYQVGK